MGRFQYVKTLCAGALAAGVLCGAATMAAAAVAAHAHSAQASMIGRAVSTAQAAGRSLLPDASGDRMPPGTSPYPERPWIEGYEPTREDALFRVAYPLLPSHNILKVYVSDEGAYGAAGIRFSARVPHSMRDITADEMERETATLIRATFDRFPDVQTLDIWGTIPVAKSKLTAIESTVFSVSADRVTYQAIRARELSDDAFLAAFGRVWIAPQVPR